ncbi:hypothetical protein G9A89_017933 [Geosiphon pyriformis]|nr:hypothetical protein G9A89_017933 [Geosiphon pyriformis]
MEIQGQATAKNTQALKTTSVVTDKDASTTVTPTSRSKPPPTIIDLDPEPTPNNQTQGSSQNDPVSIGSATPPESGNLNVINLEKEDKVPNNKNLNRNHVSALPPKINTTSQIDQSVPRQQQTFTIPVPDPQSLGDGRVFPNSIPFTQPLYNYTSNTAPTSPTQIRNDASGDEAKKTKRQHHLQVGRSYEALAKKNRWINPDGSIFPVQVDGLCNYMRFKADTSNPRSVEWYVAALKKYHHEVLHLERWEEIRKHPRVKKLTAEIEEEAAAKSMREAREAAALMNTQEESFLMVSSDTGQGQHSLTPNNTFHNTGNSISNSHRYKYSPIRPASPGSSSTTHATSIGRGIISTNIPQVVASLPKSLFQSQSLPQQLDPQNRPAEAILAMLGIEMDPAGEVTETPQTFVHPTAGESSQPTPTVINIDSDDETVTAQKAGPSSTGTNTPSSSLRRPRRNLHYTEPDEPDEDYVPPRAEQTSRKRRRKRELDMIMTEADPNEPESFKYRYDMAIAILRSKYIGRCEKHPLGCFEIKKNLHLQLNDKMIRHWAALIASGDDVTEEALPNFPEMSEFSEKHAVTITV